jgi:carbonic anhydrase
VEAAWRGTPLGLIDNWLRHVQDIAEQHRLDLVTGLTDARRVERLCELNVLEQVTHVCRTTIVQDAWKRRQTLMVHGWIYRLEDGLIRDLGLTVEEQSTLESRYRAAVSAGAGR